jgi:hypothetical protein
MNLLASARKFLAGLSGAVAVVVEANLLHGDAQRWAQTGSAVLTALLVYIVPNDRPVAPEPADVAAADPTATGQPDPTTGLTADPAPTA